MRPNYRRSATALVLTAALAIAGAGEAYCGSCETLAPGMACHATGDAISGRMACACCCVVTSPDQTAVVIGTLVSKGQEASSGLVIPLRTTRVHTREASHFDAPSQLWLPGTAGPPLYRVKNSYLI